MSNAISIKGTREGLTITLGQGDLAPLLDELGQHLETQGAFFRQGRVALRVDARRMKEEEISRVSDLLATHEMVLRTVVTTNTITQRAANTLGLRVAEASLSRERVPPRRPVTPAARPLEHRRGVLIRHLVRSGQVIRHTGHVVVIGDVNPGAEIIAGGDVVIWGRLQGTIHAGAMGKREAVVCALDLSPLQLRIGDLIARPSEDDRPRAPWPEIAHVQGNVIVVEPWNQASRGA